MTIIVTWPVVPALAKAHIRKSTTPGTSLMASTMVAMMTMGLAIFLMKNQKTFDLFSISTWMEGGKCSRFPQ